MHDMKDDSERVKGMIRNMILSGVLDSQTYSPSYHKFSQSSVCSTQLLL